MVNKKPELQSMQRYRYRATSSVSRPVVRRVEANQSSVPSVVQRPDYDGGGVQTLVKRRVTMPHQAVQPLSWSERRERYRLPVPEPPKRDNLVRRTLSQTGRPAPVGQLRISKPLPSSRGASSPVPRRRRNGRGKGFWGRLLSFLALLLIIVGGAIFALASNTFHVQHLTISGTQNQALITSIKHMGIQGQNIFLLNQSALTTRLEALPLVASASLLVTLPDTLLVTVRERVPVLLWQSGKSVYGLAQDGTIIAPASQLTGTSDLPSVIDQRTDVHVQPGTRFDAADILFIAQLFQQLPEIQGVAPFTLEYRDRIAVGSKLVPANEGKRGSYIVASAAGWQAYLGDETDGNQLSNQLIELQQILRIAQQQNLKLAVIDLRFGRRPTYTLKP